MRGLLKRRATAWPARLLLLGAIWGMSFVLIKLGNRGFTPVQVSLGRMLFGLLAVAPVLLAGRGRLPRDARTWAHLAVAAALVNSVPFTLFAFGEQHVSSVLAGIWNGTTPLFVLVVVLLTLPDERPTRERAAGLALGFAGVLVVLGAWRGVAHGELVGSAACLAAAILYGIGFPYLRRHLATGGLTVPVLAFGQLAMATLQLALIVPFAGGLPDAAPAVPLAAVAALGAVGYGSRLSAQLLDHPRRRRDDRLDRHLSRARVRDDRRGRAAGRAADLERARRRAARAARRRREPGPRARLAAPTDERTGLAMAPCPRCAP